MTVKRKIQISIDFLMAALLPFLMAYSLIGEMTHEWIGTVMFHFLKPIEGEMLRNEKLEHKNFIDECEWRYIPDASSQKFPSVLTGSGIVQKETLNKGIRLTDKGLSDKRYNLAKPIQSGRSKPWEENYSKGVYLAGVEAIDGAKAPEGWTKWTIPGYEYLYVKCTEENIFPKVIAYMQVQGLELAGAVHDFNCPAENGQGYMFFTIQRLSSDEEIDA